MRYFFSSSESKQDKESEISPTGVYLPYFTQTVEKEEYLSITAIQRVAGGEKQ